MAGLTTVDTSMTDMLAPAGGIPSPFGVNSLSMNPGPAVAERDHQPYNNLIGLPSSNMASQQLGYPMAPMAWGFDPYSSAGDARAAMDFTKQSNWIQQVIEELKDFLYILSTDGTLLYASPSCKTLTGYESDQVVGKSILDFLHTDDRETFSRELNDSLGTGDNIRFHYRFKNLDGTYQIFEAHGHLHPTMETLPSETPKGTAALRFFLMMSRPYPSKNAHLLDSFLEHKIEHERLIKRIADLQREEEEESEAHQQWLQRQDISSNTTRDNSATRDDNLKSNSEVSAEFRSLLLSGNTSKSGTPAVMGTKQNSDSITAKLVSDCAAEKVSRFDDNSYLDGIEVMTGLRYRNGERSHGISTAEPGAALIQGDTCITLPNEREYRAGGVGDKKKKQKATEEYICTDCGTLTSPEWRKGPHGPKSLCNACGCESFILLSHPTGRKSFVNGHYSAISNFPADLVFSTKQYAGPRKKKGVGMCQPAISLPP